MDPGQALMRQRLLSLAECFGTAGTEERPAALLAQECPALGAQQIRAGIKEYECPLRRKFNAACG